MSVLGFAVVDVRTHILQALTASTTNLNLQLRNGHRPRLVKVRGQLDVLAWTRGDMQRSIGRVILDIAINWAWVAGLLLLTGFATGYISEFTQIVIITW